jgi:uncharacterized membrane protein HdeD (DUF308 family)
MESKTNKNWWFLAVNGIIAMLFGLLLLLFKEETIVKVVFISGMAMAATGLCLFLVAIYNLKKDKTVGMLVFQSICCLFIGLGIMIFQDTSLHLFFIFFGIWAIVIGIFQLAVLVNVRRNISGRNIILFNGLLTIAMGIILILKKEMVPVVVQVLGAFSVLLGIVMICLSFVIRKIPKTAKNETPPPANQ